MKTQSAKAKGRRLQQFVVDLILKHLPLMADDVRSTSMGAGGEDILLSHAALQLFPYSIECKNQERVNVWTAYAQAEAHTEKDKRKQPLVVLKRNNTKSLALVDLDWFIKLHKEFVRHE